MNTTVERKYRKPVNTNGWMRKLQVWAWGRATPKFVGYCPFFWFTWLTLLLSPVILFAKIIAFLFRFVVSAIPESLAVCKPSDELLISFYETVQYAGIEEVRKWHVADFAEVFAWIAITPDWENCVKSIIAKRAKKAERQAINELKTARFANRLARYSSFIVKPLLFLAIGVLLYFAARPVLTAVAWLYQAVISITWDDVILAGKLLGVAAGLVLAVWAFVGIAARFVEGIRGCPKRPEKVGLTYKAGLAFCNGAEFLIETIEALYTRECPLIEWGDHSESIQRRDES